MSTIKAEKLQSLGSKLNFLTGATPTQRLTIDENGNVGIGTVTPTAKLQTIDTNNAARFGANNANSLTIGSRGGSPYSGIGYNVNFDSGADNQYFALGADRTSLIRFNDGGFEFKGNATNGAVSGTPFALTDYMTILKSGNVGIGTVSPDSPLHVLGAQDYGSAANSGIVTIGNANNSRQINLGVSDTNSAVYIEGWIPGTGGSNLVLQPTGGKVGIGVAAPLVALDVVGEARSSTSTTSASDAKTLTTKDYVENLNRLGSVICCLITYPDSSSSTHLSRYGITKTANTFAFTLPTGNWTGYIFVLSGVTPVSTQTNGIALQVPATSGSRTLTTYSNTTGQLSGTADNSTPTNSTISCWQTATEAIVINLVRTG